MLQIKNVDFDNINRKYIHSIRNEVFINEQGIDPEIEYDGLDNSAIHTLVFIKDKAVGTGRILKDGHIGRVAVLKKYRGQNIGSKIITSLIDVAVKNHYNRVYLGAQKQAINFYLKLGFTPFGEEFIEATILHQSMEKILD
ncbi:GNAT family N-acetyltransferase [Arcobacter sp. 15-2]|uniref:GNAT family N-acetyltransferase n=1 Tax=Arcobacter sp. 15-2 TaxID=3374109 RepID=UPI00399D3018